MGSVSFKKKILWLVTGICLIILLGVGFSYAYWRFTIIQEDKNVAVTKCLELSLTNQGTEINLNNIYPISDEDGRDLKPYTFTITNTCSMSADYKVSLEVLEGTTLNSKYLATLVNSGDIKLLSSFDTTKTTIDGSTEARILDTGILTPGASKEYSLSLWMDKSVTLSDDAQNKTFKAKVVIDATATSTIVDDIVAQLDTTGKCPTVNSDGTVNVTGAESENSLLCSAPDNYGTSYYFRGNVQNNYVKFANFYWRIVRINGDGSIRLIYDGTSAHQNGEASEDRIIGKSAFNEKYDDNAYVGYMYGTPGSSTYEETHANINDSTIKKYIDNWYENNLKNTEYEKYLAENIFCNDRSISDHLAENYNNLGYFYNSTYYRWALGPWDSTTNNKPTFLCNNKNDSLGTRKNNLNISNGKLKYNIAIVSTDEAVLSGQWRYNIENLENYLFSGSNYWTMSPGNKYYNSITLIRYVTDIGSVDGSGYVQYQYGVKPVINLKPNSLKSGNGTMDNPYTVE